MDCDNKDCIYNQADKGQCNIDPKINSIGFCDNCKIKDLPIEYYELMTRYNSERLAC